MQKEKILTVQLTENQIAILKAGLYCYFSCFDLGAGRWFAMGGSWGRSDNLDLYKAFSIMDILKKQSEIKPFYGRFADIEYLNEAITEEIKRFKKKLGPEYWDEMYGIEPCFITKLIRKLKKQIKSVWTVITEYINKKIINI